MLAGTELVGAFEGSGYRDPAQMVCRADGQLVRLPALLYQLVMLLDGRQGSLRVAPPEGGYRTLSQLADALSEETGRRFHPEHIVFLVDHKLAPLGVTTYSDGSTPPIGPKPDLFLGFRFRMTVLSKNATWFLSGLFSWLYNPFLAVLALGAFAVGEAWMLLIQDPGSALREVLNSPTGILLALLFAIISTAFHELGHATACRYGGVRPGTMGCGIYLVWPAFYTDITNSYRLGRWGRIRADLGGVYFNAIFVVGLLLLYQATGLPILLVAVLSTNLEIIQQLLPTLRFDGYYIIADLVGIPDLFKYIGPILRRIFLRKTADERLAALKRWPQLVVAGWVLFVVPALFLQLGIVLMQLPQLVQGDWQRIRGLDATARASGNYALGLVSGSVGTLLLLLPVAGIILILLQLVRLLVRILRRRLRFRLALPERVRTWLSGQRLLRPGLAVGLVLLVAGLALALVPSSMARRPPVALSQTHAPSAQPAPATTPGLLPPPVLAIPGPSNVTAQPSSGAAQPGRASRRARPAAPATPSSPPPAPAPGGAASSPTSSRHPAPAAPATPGRCTLVGYLLLLPCQR